MESFVSAIETMRMVKRAIDIVVWAYNGYVIINNKNVFDHITKYAKIVNRNPESIDLSLKK